MNYSGVNAACLAAFGQAVTFNGTTQLTAVVEYPDAPVSPRGVAQLGAVKVMGPDDLRLSVETAAAQSAALVAGATAVVSGKTYRLARLWPDAGGMTVLELRP